MKVSVYETNVLMKLRDGLIDSSDILEVVRDLHPHDTNKKITGVMDYLRKTVKQLEEIMSKK